MGKPTAGALGCEAVMTGGIGASGDGEREVWRSARWSWGAWRWKRRGPRLATQRDRIVESAGGDDVAVKHGLLAGKDGAANVAASGIGDGNCKIGGDDHGSRHRNPVRSAV